MNNAIKRTILMLTTLVMLYGFTGCDSKEANSTPVAESKDLQNSEANSGNTGSSDAQNEQSSGQSEFDFDEAVKSIIVFQHEISLPCEIKSLDNEISIDEQSKWISIGNVVSSNLYYKDKKIGTVSISESGDEEQIICLHLGFGLGNESIVDETLRKSLYDRYGWYNDEIEIDFSGLSFSSSADEVKCCLGIPIETTDAYFEDYLVYEYPDGYIWIKYYKDMITEFVIGLL